MGIQIHGKKFVNLIENLAMQPLETLGYENKKVFTQSEMFTVYQEIIKMSQRIDNEETNFNECKRLLLQIGQGSDEITIEQYQVFFLKSLLGY